MRALSNAEIIESLRGRGPRSVRDVATDLGCEDSEARAGLERMRRAAFVTRLACGCCYALAGSDVEAA